MVSIGQKILHGIVVETNAQTLTGKFLYSDYASGKAHKDSFLNQAAQIPVVGIIAGVARVALAALHIVAHTFAALVTFDKGHLYHVAKGFAEMSRGLIEATPIIGRVFAWLYNLDSSLDDEGGRSWWMIKIYNPQHPDGLDKWMDNWKGFNRNYYVKV